MKRIVAFLMAAVLITTSANTSNTSYKEAYIHQYAPTAVAEMHRAGIPASITLAQGLLESNAGRSTLAVKGNNHFGIKCHKDWKGKTMKHDDDAPQECFRVYNSPAESYRDHSDFLRYYDRYKFLFSYKTTDYKSWAYGLSKAGYATDPKYSEKLIDLIETFRLNRYDTSDDIPESPVEIEQPKESKTKIGDFREDYSFSLNRKIYNKNGVDFVYAENGETYSSLAVLFDLFKGEILKFNDLKEETDLKPGDIVYLRAKKARTARGLDKYIVAEDGENLRDIAQRFGVKLRSLEKRNGIDAATPLTHEQEIALR